MQPTKRTVIAVFTLVMMLCGQLPPLASLAAGQTTAGAPRSAASVDPGTEHYIIFMIDCSESMHQLPEPHTILAAVTQTLQVAILSDRQVKIAVILFNGNGVKILGDENDMPTSALKSLHTRLLNEWQKPNGGTPQDEAMQHCVRMVKALPTAARITVVNAGDGRPSSGRLRPDDFSGIQEEMDRQLKAIQSLPYPPGIIQELVEKRHLAWKDPTTEEFRKLYDLQIKAEFDACLEHAAVLKGRKVRFVSLDFAGQLQELRQIHDAAGGAADDYAVVRPANTVVKRIHDLGLTQLDGIIVPPPVHIPADTGSFQRQFVHPLDFVGEAALVTLVFHTPIPRFQEQAELQIEANGVTYVFDVQNHDANTSLIFDAAGNVVGGTFALPNVTEGTELCIRFQSPTLSLHAPEMTIYTHLRVSENLLIEARPEHRGPDDSPPYAVPIQHGVQWNVGLRFRDDPKFLPLTGVELVWRRETDGSEIRLDTEPNTGSPGAFRSASPVQFPPGFYDLEVHFLLESGAQLRLKLRRHVQAQQGDEHVTIQYDDSSRSDDHLDLPQIGDAVREGTATFTLRTAHIDYPVPLEVRVVGLADAQGTTPQETWIQPTQKRIQAFPGRAHQVTLRWRLPEQIEQALLDGPFTGELQVRRLDNDAILDVRPFDPALVSAVHNISDITFVLKRPYLLASSPRAFGDAIEEKDGDPQLPLPVEIGVPFERIVTVVVESQSTLPREITSTLQTPFRDASGVNVRGIEMTLADGCEATQTAEPHGKVTFTYRLLVEDVEDLRSGIAELSFFSPGVHGVRFPVSVDIREPLLGSRVRTTLVAIALLMLPFIVVAVVAMFKAKPNCTEQAFAWSARKGPRQLQAERAAKGQVRVTAKAPLTIQRQDDKHARPFNGSVRLSSDDASPDNPLLIAEELRNGDRTVFAVTDILSDAEGEPELHGHVVEGGPSDRQLEVSKKTAFRRTLAASGLAALAMFLFHSPVLAATQWVFDFLPF